MRTIRLTGKNVVLRTVEVADAAFILSLRLNKELNQYLSRVENNLQNQKDWIIEYKRREKNQEEYYFIIEDQKGTKFGTVRIYAIQTNECTWGSFILQPDKPSNFSYQSARLSFDFAFNTLGMNKIHLEVNKRNDRAIRIYTKLGFEQINYDQENLYMVLSKENHEKINGG